MKQVMCPHCMKKILIDLNVQGKAWRCPGCSKVFLLPPELVAAKNVKKPSPAVNSRKSSDADGEGTSAPIDGYLVKKIVNLLLILLLAGGAFLAYRHFTAVTPESLGGNELYAVTRKRLNRDGAGGIAEIARQDFFPAVSIKKDFFYRDAVFQSISVQKKDYDLYEGTAFFERKGKKMSRPLLVDRRGSMSRYVFPVDYAANPRHLEEDADLIFALARSIDKNLEGCELKSAKAEQDAVLTCTITKGGTSQTIRMKVEKHKGSDNIERVWVKVEFAR